MPSIEYEQVYNQQTKSPHSSVFSHRSQIASQKQDFPEIGLYDSLLEARAAASSSSRSIRLRVPWEKKGFIRHFIQISHILSLSNATTFPYLCSRYGAVSFIIAYLCSYIFVGIPALCVEMALGQFSSIPPVELFRKLSPSLSGIGVAMLAILMIKSFYISGMVAQSLFAAITTIIDGISEPSWVNCDFTGADHLLCFKHNYKTCYHLLHEDNRNSSLHDFSEKCQGWMNGFNFIHNHTTCSGKWRYWRPPYLDYMSAKIYKPIYHQKDWSLPIGGALSLAFVWTFNCILCYFGVRKLGKCMVYVKTIIFAGMLIDLALSLYFSHEDADWKNFIVMDFSSLMRLDIWADAVAHVLNSLNLGSGAVHKISSLSDFNENFLYNALLTSFMDILFSIISGLTFLSSVGYVARQIFPGDDVRHRIKFVFTHGFIITHTMFPEHMVWSLPTFGWFFAALYHVKIAVLGIPGSIVSLSIVKFAFEEFALQCGARVRWMQNEIILQRVSSLIIAIFGFLASFILVGSHGFILGKLWREFSGISLICICLCEILAISFHYGFRRYLANLQTMLYKSHHKVHLLFTLSAIWYHFFTPALIIMALCLKVITNRYTKVLGYSFPVEFEIYGWTIVLFVIIIIATPLLRNIIRYTFKLHFFESDPTWGPIKDEDFARNMKNERAVSVRMRV